jgi:hypothetical protein
MTTPTPAPLPNPDTNSESYVLAAAMYARWLAAYTAEDPDAERMLAALTSDARSYALALGTSAEILIGLLEKLDADGVVEGGVQTWLDRQALSFGAAADVVVERYRGTSE